MDIVLMILYATIVLGFLVFIHEGGHYLAARAFGVRVTEFMLGLPGPSVGFTRAGTRFGVTAVPLGGYAKVCGMEAGEMSPHLEQVLAALYRRGTANMEDIAADCGITDDDAFDALDELAEWGSVVGPTKKDQYNTYRAPAVRPAKKQIAAAEAAGRPTPAAFELGEARPVENPHDLFESEYRQQYRSLPFWKRSIILVAGVAMNLLFAILLFIVWLCVIGMDVQTAAGEIVHVNLNPLQAIQFGFMYIGAVVPSGRGPVQSCNGGTDRVRFGVDHRHSGHVQGLLRGGTREHPAVLRHDIGVSGRHEPAAHPAARRRPPGGGGVPEAHAQGGVHAGAQLPERGRHAAVPGILPGHGQPRHPTLRVRELGANGYPPCEAVFAALRRRLEPVRLNRLFPGVSSLCEGLARPLGA